MKMEFKTYIITALLVIIPMCAGIVAAYQYYDSAKSGKKLRDTTKDLVDANKRIENLQKELGKQITGEGFAIAEFTPTDDGQTLKLFIRNPGDYALYDTYLKVYNFTMVKENCPTSIVDGILNMSADCLRDYQWKLDDESRTYNPGSIREIRSFTCKPRNINIMIVTKMKHMRAIQYSIIRFDPKTHVMSHDYRIFKTDKKESSFDLLVDKSTHFDDKDFELAFHYKKAIGIHYTGTKLE